MTVRLFCGFDFDYGHELGQFNEVMRLVVNEYSKSKERTVYVLYNFHVDKQIDVALLTENGPAILEMKFYKGQIISYENGPWEITVNDEGKKKHLHMNNVYQQLWQQKFRLINKLREIRKKGLISLDEKYLYNIRCFGYFRKGSTCDLSELPDKSLKWFRFITADNLLEEINHINAGYTLQQKDMDIIVKELHLKEYNAQLYDNEMLLSIISALKSKKSEKIESVERATQMLIEQETRENLRLLVKKIRSGLLGKETFDIWEDIDKGDGWSSYVQAKGEIIGLYADGQSIKVLVRILDLDTPLDDPWEAFQTLYEKILGTISKIAPEIRGKLKIEFNSPDGYSDYEFGPERVH